MKKSWINIPNMLTTLRILLVPVYIYVFYSGVENNILFAGFIFILAGITDVLDGYIARKYDLGTKLGAILDPFADKLMTFTILITFATVGIISMWILLALGLKELVMIVGGGILYLFKGGQVLPSDKFGKTATISFYAATLSVVFRFPNVLSTILFSITVAFNLIAFINYLAIYINMSEDVI